MIPELLAPAGNWERLQTAIHFGADAVYAGGKRLSLRAFADNFTPEALQSAVAYTHERGKKLFVTLNAYLRQDDLPDLGDTIATYAATGIDALIVSDPGAIRVAKRVAPDLPLHLSTQANALNAEACAFWHDCGVARIILARECALDDIRRIREHTPPTLELEVFVHGALCISYSGRCLLSSYMNGRDGNAGACTQVCRRAFSLRETASATGNEDVYPVEEDERGTYLLNSRDLKLIDHLAELADAGVASVKIEGRMKTAYYVAATVNAYRMALDALAAGLPLDPGLHDELDTVAHRPYCKGFLLAGEGPRESQWDNPSEQSCEFVAVAHAYDPERKRGCVEQRNRFFAGDRLEVLSPGMPARSAIVGAIFDLEGRSQDAAPHPQQMLWIDFDIPIQKGDILRKRIDRQAECALTTKNG